MRSATRRRRWLSALRLCAGAVVAIASVSSASAQAVATRLAILQAEAHGAVSSFDLLAIRNATGSNDIETVRLAVRTLGRLERPSQIPQLLLSLRHPLPEVRVEAASAIAQAAEGFRTIKTPSPLVTVLSTQNSLIARLNAEADPKVRAALREAIARLPYRTPADVERAEGAIVGVSTKGAASTEDRVGIAKSLEALLRVQRSIRPAGPNAIALLKAFVRETTQRPEAELLRSARIRRLAIEGLTGAGALDEEIVTTAARDPDAQVRRLAMRGAAISGAGMGAVRDGLLDPAALVRLEALRALRSRLDDQACESSLKASTDVDMAVVLVAIDQLDACGQSPAAVAALERAVTDRSELNAPRGWHRNAHALVALATAAPSKATANLEPYASSPIWHVRLYAVRAAALLNDRATLQRLARDSNARVAGAVAAALGNSTPPAKPHAEAAFPAPTTADLRRLASPRAIVTIRDLGRFELALFTAEAPATVVRFAHLAEAGYYNGLTFDRIAPNAIVQGGGRGENDARYDEAEVGTWPHVRGAVGVSTPDTNDAQFFVNLVDNPRFDRQYPVFAQVLNGAGIIDDLLEGDVIESIVIVP